MSRFRDKNNSLENSFTIKKPFRSRLRKYIFIAFVSLIIIYFGITLKNYLSGPIIKVDSPTPYTVINTPTFELTGVVKNVKSIYINGREIQIGEDGDFKETQITKLPYTIIVINAVDRYGKTIQKVLTYGVSQDIDKGLEN